MAQQPYTIKLVEQDGAGGFTTIDTITKPVFTGPPTRTLNGMGSMKFDVSTQFANTLVGELATHFLRREVQVYRSDPTTPIWWGVPYNPSKGLASAVVSYQCGEVIPWLLAHRFFGKTNRHNLLVDPQFESGAFAPNWGVSGVTTPTVTSADSALGTYSADLVNSGAAPDASVQQTFTFTAGSIGDVVVVAGWFKVVSFTGPAIGNRGLYAEWRQSGVLKDVRYSTIDGSTPTGIWTRAQIPPDTDPNKALWIPPGVTAAFNVRGYGVQGHTRWDAMFAGLMESTSTLPSGSDIASFVAAIVAHAQDPTYDHDDLYIGTSTPATGLLVTGSYQHVEHGNIWTAGIQDQVLREEGIDVGWTYTSNSRTLHTYDRHGGATGKGADRTGLDMSIGGPYVADYGWDNDGNRAANYVTVLGDGFGPSREEGGYTDGSKFGGRQMQSVQQAPPGSNINTLDARANKLGKVLSNPGVINVQIKPGLLIEGGTTLDVGDRVTLPAYDGSVAAGVYRIVDWSLNPATDTLTVGCAPYA